jgi:hypothetical protein
MITAYSASTPKAISDQGTSRRAGVGRCSSMAES